MALGDASFQRNASTLACTTLPSSRRTSACSGPMLVTCSAIAAERYGAYRTVRTLATESVRRSVGSRRKQMSAGEGHLVELERVRKSFGDNLVLDGIDLTID